MVTPSESDVFVCERKKGCHAPQPTYVYAEMRGLMEIGNLVELVESKGRTPLTHGLRAASSFPKEERGVAHRNQHVYAEMRGLMEIGNHVTLVESKGRAPLTHRPATVYANVWRSAAVNLPRFEGATLRLQGVPVCFTLCQLFSCQIVLGKIRIGQT